MYLLAVTGSVLPVWSALVGQTEAETDGQTERCRQVSL